MNLNPQDQDHKGVQSKPVKRVWPDYSSAPNVPNSSCETKRLKPDLLAAVQAVTGAQSQIEMLKDEVTQQTSSTEQNTAEMENQPHDQQNFILQLTQERDHLKNNLQNYKVHEALILDRLMVILTEVAELHKDTVDEQQEISQKCDNAKVLLEQQLHALQSRVDAMQPLKTELDKVKEKLASLESYLGKMHMASCPHVVENASPQYVLNPTCNGVNMNTAAPSFQPQPQFPQLSEKIMPLRENKVYTERQDPNGPIQRLQKRLQLVTRERDGYKYILERSKCVENAKKMLEKFGDMVALTSEDAQTKLELLRAESNRLREEGESLKLENAKLLAERDAVLKQKRERSQTKAKVRGGRRSCASPKEAQQLKKQ